MGAYVLGFFKILEGFYPEGLLIYGILSYTQCLLSLSGVQRHNQWLNFIFIICLIRIMFEMMNIKY